MNPKNPHSEWIHEIKFKSEFVESSRQKRGRKFAVPLFIYFFFHNIAPDLKVSYESLEKSRPQIPPPPNAPLVS